MEAPAKSIKKPTTLDDLLAIPEEVRRHEIIAGELVEKEAASGKHGSVQGRTFQSLRHYNRRPGAEVRAAGGS